MATKAALFLSIVMALACLNIRVQVSAEDTEAIPIHGARFNGGMRRMQEFKDSLIRRDLASDISPSPAPSVPPPQGKSGSKVYYVTSYGADPSGKSDSTDAILKAISDAYNGPRLGNLIEGITNLGGAQIHLEGGNYLISKPLQLPAAGAGNLMIHGGTLTASDNFPTDGYLIDLSAATSSSSANKQEKNKTLINNSQQLASGSSYNYEYITLKDLMLDSNFRGGAIQVINSLRTSIDNCYIVHFSTNGILVQSGHETYIRNSFLGQHITAGGDPGERNFSGTAINLMGNDNAVTDVVIFSAAVGIMVSGLTQTRIVNSYMDYTSIVAEDPVQLHISSSFFLGDAFILLKSINGVANGVNIVDNMFSGSDKGVEIVQLDESKGPFKQIDQVVVHRNNVRGMNLRATVGRGSMQSNGSSWTVDFSSLLLFPNLINHVQYSLITSDSSFPNHALRNVSANRVVIESDKASAGSVFVTVNQGGTN
ncbi:hypothetical protein Pint_12080 [Pistacia integerrima]|uniref:Uncharacterized protein n=1 Tax=Pistacia integerrima TaxID=434235 RepID=A0ACC0XKX2_9ROSI|nr:hypothetical protein Pint_12080 [Pistacia integerrima]